MLRCAAAGIFGGLLFLLLEPYCSLWKAIACLALGLLSLAMWYWGIGSRRPPGARTRPGPTFNANDPEVAGLLPTTTGHLGERIRQVRERQKRAGDGGPL